MARSSLEGSARELSRQQRRKGSSTLKGLLFASPFLVGFALLFAYPIASSGVYSFTSFNLFQPPTWIGLANYRELMGDSVFWTALGNTAVLTLVGVPLTILISLLGAHILNLPVRGQPLYRALLYVPVVVPVVVGSYLWRWLLNTQYGFVDYFLGLLGLPQPAWLTQPAWGRPAVLIVTMWAIGSTMLIYLAALKDVPQELYEAAQLDGAGSWKRFLNVTWPALTPITLFQIFVVMVSFLQIFTQPYLLSQDATANNSTGNAGGNGAGNSMLTIATYIYENAFQFLKMGYASAIAWILFVIIAVISILLFLTSKKWVHYDND